MQLERIIEECLQGEEGAWKMLVDTYSKKVFNLAYQFAGSYEEAEDLTQDIFFKLHHSIEKYDFESDKAGFCKLLFNVEYIRFHNHYNLGKRFHFFIICLIS